MPRGARPSIDVGQGVAGARRVLVDEKREALLELLGQLPLEALHCLWIRARRRRAAERRQLRALLRSGSGSGSGSGSSSGSGSGRFRVRVRARVGSG